MRVRNWAIGGGLLLAGYLLASADGVQQAKAILSRVVNQMDRRGSTTDLPGLERSLQNTLTQFSQQEAQLRSEMGVIQQRVGTAAARSNDIRALLAELKCLHAKAEESPSGKVIFLDRDYSRAELVQQIDLLLEEQAALESERGLSVAGLEKLQLLADDCGARSGEAKRHLAQMSTYKAISRTQASLSSMDQGLAKLQDFLSESNTYFSGASVREVEDLLKQRKRQAALGAKRVTVEEFLAEVPNTASAAAAPMPPSVEPPRANEGLTPEAALLDLQRNLKSLAIQP